MLGKNNFILNYGGEMKMEEIKISDIRRNPYQPRMEFDEEKLSELADSIRSHGVIQPIILRKSIKGYDIVAARDGEEALTVAMKERPDLIISDVMMPKISGFDMLDIIRSTEETKDVKVIMMTALSQAEDKARADKLGADRYLVKSQVTLEDVAKVAREVLNGTGGTNTANQSQSAQTVATVEPPATPIPAPVASPQQQNAPTTSLATPVTASPPATDPAMAAVSPTTPLSDDAQALSQSSDKEQAEVSAQIDSFIDSSRPAPAAETIEQPATTDAPPESDQTASEVHKQSEENQNSLETQTRRTGKKVIQPLNDPTSSKGPDLHKLLEKEQEKSQMAAIAQDIAAKNSEHSFEKTEYAEKTGEANDESVAEETLRKAAERREVAPASSAIVEQTAPTKEDTSQHAPEVAISEDGNLHLASSPEVETTDSQESSSAMNYEEAPAPVAQPVEAAAATDESELAKVAAQLQEAAEQPEPLTPPQQPQPNIPHTNGTSIDGVSTPGVAAPATSTQMPEPQSVSQQSQPESPDDIAL